MLTLYIPENGPISLTYDKQVDFYVASDLVL